MKQTIWQRCRLTFELFPEIAPTVWGTFLYGGFLLLILIGISSYSSPGEEVEGVLKLAVGLVITWRAVTYLERVGRRRPRAGHYPGAMVPPPGFVGPRPMAPMRMNPRVLHAQIANTPAAEEASAPAPELVAQDAPIPNVFVKE